MVNLLQVLLGRLADRPQSFGTETLQAIPEANQSGNHVQKIHNTDPTILLLWHLVHSRYRPMSQRSRNQLPTLHLVRGAWQPAICRTQQFFASLATQQQVPRLPLPDPENPTVAAFGTRMPQPMKLKFNIQWSTDPFSQSVASFFLFLPPQLLLWYCLCIDLQNWIGRERERERKKSELAEQALSIAINIGTCTTKQQIVRPWCTILQTSRPQTRSFLWGLPRTLWESESTCLWSVPGFFFHTTEVQYFAEVLRMYFFPPILYSFCLRRWFPKSIPRVIPTGGFAWISLVSTSLSCLHPSCRTSNSTASVVATRKIEIH